MVLPRIITAVLLIPLVLAAVWYGSIPFFLFVLGVCLLCTWEYATIADQGGYPNQLVLSLIGTVLILLALFLDGIPVGPIQYAPSVLFVFVIWTFLVILREFFRKDLRTSALIIMSTIFGVILCGLFLGHLLLIRDLKIVSGEGIKPIGREFLFYILFVIWAFDTGSYFMGTYLGRIPFLKRISPKKTWEGAIGGTLVAIFAGWLCREIFLQDGFSRWESVLFAIIIALTALASDLLESLLKRSFGVKDSSKILPGHGGLLDRFDSFIFAAPIFYYLLIATGRFR